MDRAELKARARGLDLDLQALAAVYEALWETLQDELDGGADLDPDGTIGKRLLGLATGIPHLGRIFGPQDPPVRAVYVVSPRSRAEAPVRGVFLSGQRAQDWVARRRSPELYEVEPHALGYPELTEELRRRRAARDSGPAAENRKDGDGRAADS